jgi:hypothetical protein
MTNDNRIIELMKAFNSPIANAILWERIQRIAAMTKEGATENPEVWTNPFISAKEYIQWAEKVEEIANMQVPDNSQTHYLLMSDDAFDLYTEFIDDSRYISLSDCLKAMDEDNCCYEVYTHNEGNRSYKLLETTSMYSQWVILQPSEVAELKEEGLI